MLALSGLAGAAASQDDGGWRAIYEEQGIVVSTREQPGHELPSFRGEGELKGSVLHVLAIVLDDARTKEWATDADETEVLKTLDTRTQLIYSRSHQTWPVRDRDLVMKRTVEVVKPAAAFRVRLVCVTGGKPEVSSAIRIKDCETVFALRKVDETTTHVEYRVRADPGGSNPAWAVRWASKNIPLETLLALRKQVLKTRGHYDDVIRTWANAH
jgi:START domain